MMINGKDFSLSKYQSFIKLYVWLSYNIHLPVTSQIIFGIFYVFNF